MNKHLEKTGIIPRLTDINLGHLWIIDQSSLLVQKPSVTRQFKVIHMRKTSYSNQLYLIK